MRTTPAKVPGSLALLGLSWLVCPPTTHGQCIDYEDYLHRVGSLAMPSGARDVAVVGNHAYVAEHTSLSIVNVYDPASPTIEGTLALPARPLAIVVAGNHVYVACDVAGFLVVDVSNPTAPAISGSLPTQGWATDVAISGSFAYVTCSSSGNGEVPSGLRVVNVSDPTAPTFEGGVDTPGTARGVAVSGSYAYVADWDEGLHVVDVSIPSHPWIVATILGWKVDDVAVAGTRAYVVHHPNYIGSRVDVVDISNPALPVVIGEIAARAWGIAVRDNHLYLAEPYTAGLSVVDLSTGTLVGRVHTPRAWAVAVSGDYAYIADRDVGLEIMDVSNPVSPTRLGWAYVESQWTEPDVAVAGDFAYIATGPFAVLIADVSDPASPVFGGDFIYTLGAEANGVEVFGSYLYIAASQAGGVLIADLDTHTLVGQLDTCGDARDVAVSGNYAYVGAACRFQVADISDPFNPVEVGSVNLPSPGRRVAVSGSHAYVAFGHSTPLILDVSNPAVPEIVTGIDTPSANDVVVSGDFAYVACDSGLFIADVSDPTEPAVVACVDTPEEAWRVTLSGGYAYVAADRAGLQVIDVSDPTSPWLVGNADLWYWLDGEVLWSGEAFAITLLGDYVYVVDKWWALHVLPAQCDEPPIPVRLSGFMAVPVDRNVLLSWFTSFESLHDGFNVYRSPSLTHGYARLNDGLIRGRNPYSYLDSNVRPSTEYYYQLGAVDLDGHEVLYGPTSATTLPWGQPSGLSFARPSPFRERTSLHFTLAAPAKTSLAVYDVAGRRVRTLVEEELPEGDHEAIWDGRDDGGLRVSGGTYFAKLTTGDVTQTRKVVFLGGK